MSPDAGYTSDMCASSHDSGVGDTSFVDTVVPTDHQAGDALAVVAYAVLNTKPVRLEGASS